MSDFEKILVIQPSWVGDAIMATPTLRALRELYPAAHISYLLRRYVKPVYTGMPWCDRLITFRTGRSSAQAGRGLFELAARLRAGRFDAAILLPNSFKTALLCKMARIPRIVGYERDGRSFLLSDRLLPAKERGKYIPTPVVDYYLGLARYLGSRSRDTRLELFITEAQRRQARQILQRAGLDGDIHRPAAAGGPPLILLNPGAQYGEAKCWLPENFAAVGDRLIEQTGATVLISGAPRERLLIEAVKGHMKGQAVDLLAQGLTLGALKDIVRRCDLMIGNDTGPRHMASAFGVPVVTVFGPTHPEWSETRFHHERKAMVKVFCGPCQKKRCPLDHRCMTRVSPHMVSDLAAELLGQQGAPAATQELA
jgi:heptosyltransferase II